MRSLWICPSCGSRRIQYASTMAESGSFVGLGLPEMFYCKDCKYKGPIVVEIDAGGEKRYKQYIKKHRKIPEKQHKMKRDFDALRAVFVSVLVMFFIVSALLLIPQTHEYEGAGTALIEAQEQLKIEVGEEEAHISGMKETTAGFDFEGARVFVRISPAGDNTRIRVSTFGLEEQATVRISKEDGTYLAVMRIDPPGMMESGTGISTVTGFSLNIFLIIFTVGLVVLMIYSHWHRLRAFL